MQIARGPESEACEKETNPAWYLARIELKNGTFWDILPVPMGTFAELGAKTVTFCDISGRFPVRGKVVWKATALGTSEGAEEETFTTPNANVGRLRRSVDGEALPTARSATDQTVNPKPETVEINTHVQNPNRRASRKCGSFPR